MPRRVKRKVALVPQERERAPSLVERTADEIALAIVSGKYAPGERLASVRELAVRYGINPSTVQVVLGRLESSGLVTAHPRLGVVVCDVEQAGGIPSWRYIFRFAQQVPERAIKILADILDMRLVLIGQAVGRIAAAPSRFDPSSVRRAVDRMEIVLARAPTDPKEVARAELHALRALTLASGQSVVTAVINSIGEIYLEESHVIEAMYADPRFHLTIWRKLLAQWDSGKFAPNTLQQLEQLFRAYDEDALRRFRKILTAEEERNSHSARAAVRGI